MVVTKISAKNFTLDFKKLAACDAIEVDASNGVFSFIKQGSSWKLVEGFKDSDGKVKKKR